MRFGDFELDPDRQLLRLRGQQVHAEPKVLAVIAYLAGNRTRVVPKQELLEQLWEESFVSESALTRVIRDARKVLGDSSSEPRFIRTVYGKGFLWVATVDSDTGKSAAAGAARPSIAVLPFQDLSADQAQAYFCEGLADEIINALARIESLEVISRMSSFDAGRRGGDSGAIGRLLGVTHVLEGSVRRAGERVRVTVQLVEVAGGRTWWSDRYDGSTEDVFAIQETIAEQTATALVGVLGEGEKRAIHDRPHPGVRAWEYYLKGRQLYYEDTPRTHEAARQMYVRAIEIEPGFALGWSGLATVLADSYLHFRRRDENRAEADRASLRALEIDDTLPDVHTSRALALMGAARYEEAVTEFEAAIALDPRSFDAHHNFARLLWTIGRREQAILHAERAAAVRPDDYLSTTFLMQAYFAVGRESERVNAALRTIELTRRRLELRPADVRTLCFNAEAHWVAGQRDKAMKRIEDAYRIDPNDVCTLYNSACVFALDGQTERALEAIEGAVRGGYANREWLENDPDLAVLLEQLRFRRLIDSLAPLR